MLWALLACGLAAPDPAGAQDLHVDSIGHDYGSEEAGVHVIEFSDFGCGYCRRFHQDSRQALLDEYVSAGTVRWKYVTYVSGMFPHSREASLTAECVTDQGRFEAMRDRLFERQAEWRRADDPTGLFLDYAEEVGADRDRTRACLNSSGSEDRVNQGTRLGLALGVRGTPTFIMGALPLDSLREVLDRRIAAASGSPAPSR